MSEQSQELRRINWTECFSFTNIFRTFRLAAHPGKVLLAFAGILVMVATVIVMDAIWSGAGRNALPNEVAAFIQPGAVDDWREAQMAAGKMTMQQVLAGPAVDAGIVSVGDIDDQEEYADGVARIFDGILDHYADVIDKIDGTSKREDLVKLAGEYGLGAIPEGLTDPDDVRERLRRAAWQNHRAALQTTSALQPKGIGRTFLQYERDAVRQFVGAACELNIIGGLEDVMSGRTAAAAALTTPDAAGPGVLPSVLLMGLGVKWLLMEHFLYALIFLLVVLASWSILGGALCRIAAMHATRDEKIPVKQALRFARHKFVGFFAAPLIPILLIIFIGVALIVAGLVAAIPYLGDFVAGLLFVLAIVGGFVMTLVLIGAVGGGSLMWPTIAVEGSDSFDAISRSFSYVYSRPWRAGFYYLVLTVYGALVYLFVRFFVLALFKLTRLFTGVGMFPDRPGAGPGASKIDAVWMSPTFDALVPGFSKLGVQGGDAMLGWWILLWLALTVAIAYALMVSFYFCGSTIIYLLLRRKVDATDIEEVYLEEAEEEPTPAPDQTPAPATTPTKAPSDAGGAATTDSGGGDGNAKEEEDESGDDE
jgi:hypothetical protein